MPFDRIKRPVAGTVLVAFLALVLQPLSILAQDRPASAASRRAAESGEEKFSRTLNEIHEILKELAPQAAMPHMFPRKKGETELRAIGPNMKIESEPAKPAAGVDVAAKVSQLRAKATELTSLEQHVRAGFDEAARHIKEKNLPAEILARHEEALKAYEARAAEFKALVGAVDRSAAAAGAPLQTALNDLAAFMAKYPNQKTHTPTDPNNLPWGSPKPVTREPYTSPSQFRTSRLFGEPVRVAQAGSLSGISLPSTTLPATPAPADLAPTEDVQITQTIRDLAASLNNHPVQIYNWVRNNIEFVPSYGSIQGSDMTLQTKRGNSFDTASLLIALFRAANIPARYVYGTIEMPADKAMNWVGGVTVPHAAMNLMGQGGIPVIGIAQSGVVRSIRLEHVWVEAFVDYVPSRGAVNRAGDTWVPMDASFKQHSFTAGMDIRTNVPPDAQTIITNTSQGATTNAAEGWIQNVNQQAAAAGAANYESEVRAYIAAQKPNATAADVLGGQAIVQENPSILFGTLPYQTLLSAAKFQAIPDNLRWKFRYQLFANATDRAYDSPFVTFTRSTSALAGRKITLSYRPASQADQDLISSFLPRPHADGTPLQPHEFPESLPAYLIRVVPELRVGEEVVASGPVFQMGSELVQNAAYLNAATGSWEAGEDNFPLVGEYIATALDLQGLGASQIDSIKTRLQATAARIEQFQQSPGDPTPVQSLTKEQLVGDVLYGVILSYLAATSQVGRNAARTIGAIAVRMPSFGNFGVSSTPQFQFGIARNVRFRALQMDVDRISQAVVSKNADRAQSIALARMMGFSYSAFEHLVPEMFFTPRDQPGSLPAISAVKALELANQAGQKIYTLNSQNQSIHFQTISQLNIDASVKQELLNALAVGREVTVHQSTLSANGFFGVGYIIFDPETGSGAYKVSGGANGGLIITATLFVAALMTVFGLFFLASTVGVLLFIYGIAFFAMAAFAAYMTDMLDPEIMFVVRHILLVFAITSPFISVPLMVQIFWAIVINALLANIYLFFKNR